MRVLTEAEAYDEERFPETSRVKRRLRETEEGRIVMDGGTKEIWAEGFTEGFAESFEGSWTEGIAIGKAETLGKLVRAGLVDAHAGAASLGIDFDEVERMLVQRDLRPGEALVETDAHDEERFPAMPSERRGPRKTEGGRVFMSNVSEEIWAEGFAEGFAESFAESFARGWTGRIAIGKVKTLGKLVRAGLVDARAGAASLGLDPDEVERMLA